MNQPFEIKFDFPLGQSDLSISLKASVEIHHSEVYYLVDNFHLDRSCSNPNDPSILPNQEIKQIKRGANRVWVHKDSERESLLSLAIGKAIDEVMQAQKA